MRADTIVAVATAPGSGGIGVVRLSGPGALAVAARLLVPPGGMSVTELAPRVLTRAVLRAADDLRDDVLAAVFPAPHSYTGEDVVEIHAHGSPVILDATVRAACVAGARVADPGEFTHRAFLNGRMDLAQAEAVADVINARTSAAARCAGRQLAGGLSSRIETARDALLHLLAEMEAGLDFAEDELELPSNDEYKARVEALRADVDALLATAAAGRLLHDGATVALVGRPNVGKSSLFNALLERERAIVTAEPGTTRDTVEGEIDLDGAPVRLVDTAGLRETTSEAEAQGIARSRAAAAAADVILWVVDRSEPLSEADAVCDPAHHERTILVYNKVDLPAVAQDAAVDVAATVEVSAKTGAGVGALHAALKARLNLNGALGDETPVIVRARHAEELERARRALDAAAGSLDAGVTLDCVAVDVREAMDALGAIVGAHTTEDVLNHIFGEFCIGK